MSCKLLCSGAWQNVHLEWVHSVQAFASALEMLLQIVELTKEISFAKQHQNNVGAGTNQR
jgi:hypothetical protein